MSEEINRMARYWQRFDDLAAQAQDAGKPEAAIIVQALKAQTELMNMKLHEIELKLTKL
jgi:hypothetical protein